MRFSGNFCWYVLYVALCIYCASKSGVKVGFQDWVHAATLQHPEE